MKNKHFFSYLPLAIFLTGLLAGCANLDKINDFASSAQTGAAGFEALPVTFNALCLNDCKERDIKAAKLNLAGCDCSLAMQADNADALLYKTIAGYLDGLEKLSAGKTTSYTVDSLSTQLTNLKVPAATAGAYTQLGSILTKAITDGYRRNKIKRYIREANLPLQVLLTYLGNNVGTSLAIRLGAYKSKLESDYLDLLKNSQGNDFEKRQIIEEFYAQNTTLQHQLTELKAYSLLLKTIAVGHQQLTDNLDKLDKNGLKSMLSQYASNIKDIRTQIQILKQ